MSSNDAEHRLLFEDDPLIGEVAELKHGQVDSLCLSRSVFSFMVVIGIH